MISSQQQVSDEGLAQKVRERDHEALAILVKKHSKSFYRLAYRLLENQGEAEDMVQTAFLKFWQDPQKFNSNKNAKFTTWFYRVVLNLCLDHLKKKRPFLLGEQESSLENISYHGHSHPEEQIQLKEKRRIVTEAIRNLPKKQRAALTLCYDQNLKQKEAAEILGIKLKALESLLSRAKRQLTKHCQHIFEGGSL